MAGTGSFDHSINDYFYLKFKDVNNSTASSTGFTIPNEGISWMIEVADMGTSPPWDYINISVYEEHSGFNIWQPTIFGASPMLEGAWNGSSLWINSAFETLFPVPFIVPTNSTNVTVRNQWMTDIFGLTIRNSLLNHYEYCLWYNGSQMLEVTRALLGDEIADTVPFEWYAYIYAWNGTWGWIERDMRQDPIGETTGEPLLVALYMSDGQLHYLRESWWDNDTIQADGYGTWRTSYKLVSPMMEYIGALFEGIFPGSESSIGDIPSFPFAMTLFVIVVIFSIAYKQKLKKPFNY